MWKGGAHINVVGITHMSTDRPTMSVGGCHTVCELAAPARVWTPRVDNGEQSESDADSQADFLEGLKRCIGVGEGSGPAVGGAGQLTAPVCV